MLSTKKNTGNSNGAPASGVSPLRLAAFALTSLGFTACSTTVSVQTGTGDPKHPTSASEIAWAKVKGGLGTSFDIHFRNMGYEETQNHIKWAAKQSGLSDHCTNQILRAVCPVGIKDRWVATDINAHNDSMAKVLLQLTQSARNAAEAAALVSFAQHFDGFGDTNVKQVNNGGNATATGGSVGPITNTNVNNNKAGVKVENPTTPTNSCNGNSCKAKPGCSGPNGCGQ